MISKPACLLVLLSTIFSQPNQDARMLGLNGSYTTLASGFRAVGINPANLAGYKNKSLNIIDFSLGLNNNYLSIENYNALSGSHLDDTEHENYFPKGKVLDEFGGLGLRMRQSLIIPLPFLNMSTHRMALTSRLSTNIDMGISDGMVQVLFSGNSLGKDIYIDIEELFYSTQEFGFSYGHSFQGYSVGITVKYLLGLFYMGMESLSSATITTDADGFHGNPQYILRQAIGGNGLGLDVGILSEESNNGFRFGMSIINLLGTIKWTQNNSIRKKLEPELRNMSYYLKPNELMYINMVIDSVDLETLENLDSTVAPLAYYEIYKVSPVEAIDPVDDSEYVVNLSDGTFLYPSCDDYKKVVLLGDGDEDEDDTISDNCLDYPTEGDNPFTTRIPMYFRMGISKRWENQAVVAADLVTGFSNRSGSSSTWRLSLGAEITRFKNNILRLGYAIGGVERKSLSFGYGTKIGSIYFDIGLALNGGFSLDSAKGFDVAAGIIWQFR